MRLQRLTGLERDKIIADYEAVMKEIAKLEEILASEVLIKGIIKEEFKEILENYGDERKTEIINDSEADDIQYEDLIQSEDVIVTVTHKGYLKRMAMDTYRTQKRGGKGVKGADIDEDFYTKIFTANTHDTIMFFTNLGTVFSRKVYEIPEGQRTTKGRNIVNLIQLGADEKVLEVVTIPKDFSNKFLIISTKSGLVKKTALEEYSHVKQNGIKAIKLTENDTIVNVRVTDGNKDVLLCATTGKIIRFAEKDCRPLGRVSQGVKGIELDDNEKVIGMEIIDDNVEILSITENGYGKRTSASEYRKQSRGGKGIIAMKLTEKNGDIVQIKPVTDKEDLVIITNSGQVIRTKISGISLLGRNTQGVRLINLNEGEKVVAVEKLAESEDEGSDDGETLS
jgi:DNA gyrase subunit A